MAMAIPRTQSTSFSSILYLLFFIFSSSIFLPLATSLSFHFPSFNQSTKGISYQGHAKLVNDSIHLTPTQPNSFGRAIYSDPILVWDSLSKDATDFTTQFSFIVADSDTQRLGDGFAFFLSPYPSEIPDNNSNGTYLALFNGTAPSSIKSNQVVAIQFDTSGNKEVINQSSDKVVVDVNNFSVTSVSLDTGIRQGLRADAWIRYNFGTKNLSVGLSYPPDVVGKQNWTLSHIVDLREVLPQEVAVGFSSGSINSDAESHRILSWDFESTLGTTETNSSGKKKNIGLILGLSLGIGLLLLGSGLICLAWWYTSVTSSKMEDVVFINNSLSNAFDRGGGPRRFSYAQLANATRSFSEERVLGKGGFGEVYRGFLNSAKLEVAIKRISRGSKQGKKEYIAEVTIISRLRHRNLVQLIGYCHEKGDLLLVYEFMANGSLDDHLYNKERLLQWPERYKIVVGLATALLYLHEEWEQCVVHRDLKPSNVMLDSEFNPKLGDFGLARLVDHDRGSLTTNLAGTRGYMAPEYLISGKASKESDIYSFGVVALEIVCGRKPIERAEDIDKLNLVQWVWELYGNRSHSSAVDERLQGEFNEDSIERVIIIGLWCAHPDSKLRPSIRQVINALSFDDNPLPALPPKMPVALYIQPSSDGSSDNLLFNTGEGVSNSAMQGR